MGKKPSFLSNIPRKTEADDSVVQISRQTLKLKLGMKKEGEIVEEGKKLGERERKRKREDRNQKSTPRPEGNGPGFFFFLLSRFAQARNQSLTGCCAIKTDKRIAWDH